MSNMTKLVMGVLLLAVITFGVGFGYLTGGDGEGEMEANSVTTKKRATSAKKTTPSPKAKSVAKSSTAAASETSGSGNPALESAAPKSGSASGSFPYRFRKGDTVGKILRRLGRPLSDINRVIDLNPGLNIERIPVGATVRLPGAPGTLPAAPEKPIEVARLSTESNYTIRPGDTLSSIANRMYRDPRQWKRIARANPGVNPNTIRVGQKIAIPR